jgi:hypothetical protein
MGTSALCSNMDTCATSARSLVLRTKGRGVHIRSRFNRLPANEGTVIVWRGDLSYLQLVLCTFYQEKAEAWIEAWTQGGNNEVDVVFEFHD